MYKYTNNKQINQTIKYLFTVLTGFVQFVIFQSNKFQISFQMQGQVTLKGEQTQMI